MIKKITNLAKFGWESSKFKIYNYEKKMIIMTFGEIASMEDAYVSETSLFVWGPTQSAWSQDTGNQGRGHSKGEVRAEFY